MDFKLPQFEMFSFWIGILLSTIFWWIIHLLRPILINKNTTRYLYRKRDRKKQSFVYLEQIFRENILLKAQTNHLTSQIFSLDEIATPPRFLSAPSFNQIESTDNYRDLIYSSIPYTPGWTELAAIYKKPTLSVEDVIKSGSDFVIVGFPGTGKSVALAYITSLLANKKMIGVSTEYLPIYFHISELSKQSENEDPLSLITNLFSKCFSIDEQPLIIEFLRKFFDVNQIIILIDGMDELIPADFDQASLFIKLIKGIYPNLPIITTASPDYMDGLVSLNFSPISISAWSDEEKHDLCENWAHLWVEHITKKGVLDTKGWVDPILLNAWILNDLGFLSPLELTLTLWGAYSGDLSGSSLSDILSAFIQRSVSLEYLGLPIETLSLKLIMTMSPTTDRKFIDDWFHNSGVRQTDSFYSREGSIKPSPSTGIQHHDSIPIPDRDVSTSVGIFILNQNNKYHLAHPIFLSYLAGKNITKKDISNLMAQPQWIGRDLTLQMYAILDDPSTLVNDLLAIPDPPLYTNLFLISRWLRVAPPNNSWTEFVVTKLLSFVQEDIQPVGLRSQAIISLIYLGSESAIPAKYRELHKSQNSNLQQLSALGSGAFKDRKAIGSLSQLNLNPKPHVRNSSCLALSIIDLQESIDALSIVMLTGDDNQRRIAAEALSINVTLGHNVLREAASMKDLFIRRAATFGISRIKEVWASKLLSQIQLDDPDWAVRSAAQDAIESQGNNLPALGRKILPPTETPWIIAYAGRQGIGVVPNKVPVDLLLSILTSGLLEEKIASLPYLRTIPSIPVFQAIYKALYTGEPELRDAIFLTLKEMSASGIALPDPNILNNL
jgi:HEAT repeat protein